MITVKAWFSYNFDDLKSKGNLYHKNVYFSEFQEAFQLFDSRGDGKIHVAQIGDALRALGQNPTESDVKKFTHQHKPDERISFEVFLPIYQAISKARTSDTADDFIEGLRHFDKDGNGFISSAELRHLLTTLGKIFFFRITINFENCFEIHITLVNSANTLRLFGGKLSFLLKIYYFVENLSFWWKINPFGWTTWFHVW